MKYIDSWLQGLGLDYVIPKLKAHGVTTPKKLAQLTLRDMFDYGVEDSEDRKKLYFLVQRLQTILNSKAEEAESQPQEPSDNANHSIDGDPEDRSPNPKVGSTDTDVAGISSNDENKRNSQEIKAGGTGSSDKSGSGKSVTSLTNGVKNVRPTAASTASRSEQRMPSQSSNATVETNDLLSRPPLQSQSNSQQVAGRVESVLRESQVAPQSKRVGAPMGADKKETSGGSSQRSLSSKSSHSQLSAVSLNALATDDTDNLLDRKINMFLSGGQPAPVKKAPSVGTSNMRPRDEVSSSTVFTNMSKPASLPSVSVVDTPAVAPVTGHSVSIVKSASNQPFTMKVPTEKSAPSVGAGVSTKQAPVTSLPVQPLAASPSIQTTASTTAFASVDLPDMTIRVVVRKRPISRTELQRGDSDVMEIDEAGGVYIHEPKVRVDLTKVTETHQFFFDDAFEADESNELIYSRTIGQLVPFVFDGGKASCFAYGQTGSGKTFTMMGANPAAPDTVLENAGLYVIAARDIFGLLQTPEHRNLQLFVSCFEIYGGKLFDLLNDRGVVKCLEDAKQQVQLLGLSEHKVESVQGLLGLMGKAHSMRSTGCTGANATSSRSHQVMQLVVKELTRPEASSTGGFGSRHRAGAVAAPVLVPRGKLSFIDLAGSERGADTNNASKQTRLEGAEINTSLLALKEVIRSLERKHGHTPFRGSKLTQVLKDSFVGDKSRTCMIACVSPSHSNCEHTLNTLRYADRVKEHQSSQNGNSGSATPTYVDGERASSPSARERARNAPGSPTRGISGSPVRGIATSPVKSNRPASSGRMDNRPPPLPPMAPSSSRSALGSDAPTSRRASVGNLTSRSTAADDAKGNRRMSLAPGMSSSASMPSKLHSAPQSHRPISGSSTKSSVGSSARSQSQTDSGRSVVDTRLAENTTTLLAAHKSTISKLVEMMKLEMQLVQDMESSDDRDSEIYVDRLEELLGDKSNAIAALRSKIKTFQYFRLTTPN